MLDDIPETNTMRVVYAQLSWAASTPGGAQPDLQVTLTPPGGDSAGGGTLNGEWTVQDVEISGGRDDDPDTVASAVASIVVGAWSLIVVYEDDPGVLPLRRLYYYQGFELNAGQNRQVVARGFLAPNGQPVVDLTYLVYEGDNDIQGDALEINGRRVSNDCNPQNNLFNDTVSSGRADGQCVRGVRGVDLDTFRVEDAIFPGDEQANINFIVPQGNLFAPGEQIFTHWLMLAFDHRLPDFDSVKPEKEAQPPTGSTVDPGSTIDYAIVVENEGDDVATNTTVTDGNPVGTRYVAGSARINGRPVMEIAPGINPFAGGLNLGELPEIGDIEPGERHVVQFQVQVEWETPEGTELVNIAEIVADGIEPVRTDAVIHDVGAQPEGGPPDAALPPDVGVFDAGVEDPDMMMSVPDATPGADASLPEDGGPMLGRRDASVADPCGRGTRLDPETGSCVSLCGAGLRWDPFCGDGGQCVQESDPPCDTAASDGCDCQVGGQRGPSAGFWLLLVGLLGLRRRRS